MNNILDILPYSAIDENYIYQSDSCITIAYEFTKKPEVYCISDSTAETFNTYFEGLLKSLPIKTNIQIQELVYTKQYEKQNRYNSFVYNNTEQHFNMRNTVVNTSRIFFTFRTYNSKKPKSSFYITQLWTKEFKKNNDLINQIEDAVLKIESMFQLLKEFDIKRLKNDDILTAIYQPLNLDYSSSYQNQTINPIHINNDGELKVGNENVKIITMTNLPVEFNLLSNKNVIENYNGVKQRNIPLKSSLFFPLTIGLPMNHIFNLNIEILDKEELGLGTEAMGLNFITYFSKEAQNKQDAINTFQELLASESNMRPVKISSNVIIHDSDKEELNKKINLAKNIFESLGLTSWIENLDTAQNFIDSLPGAMSLYKWNILTTSEVAPSFVPLETVYYSDKGGYTYQDRSGTPKIIEIYNNKNLVSKSGLVLGPTGTGKSFWLNYFIALSLDMLYHVTVLDIGRSFEKLIQYYNGNYFDSSDKSKLSFNIFLTQKDNKGNYLLIDEKADKEDQENKIVFIISVITTAWKQGLNPVTQEEKTILREAVIKYYDYVNENKLNLGFKTFYEYFLNHFKSNCDQSYLNYLDFDSFKISLKPYADGEYSELLNSNSNINLTYENFTVFELEAIKANKDIFNIVSVIIIELFLEKVRKINLPKILIIDEGLDFLKSGNMSEFIAYLYRTIRKKGGQVILATQNVNQMADIPKSVMASISGNSAIKVLLSHQDNSELYTPTEEFFGFNDLDMDLFKSTVKHKEFFIKMGDKSTVMGYELPRKLQLLFTTNKDELNILNPLIEKYGIASAIDRMVHEEENKS